MPEAKENVAQLLVLLRHIPAYNHTATTTFLEKLRERGFTIDMRTVERDIETLTSFTLKSSSLT